MVGYTNLKFILILCSVQRSITKENINNAACVNDIRDMDNKAVKLEEYCKNNFCLPKCCAGANSIIVVNNEGEICVDKNDIANLNFTNFNHLQMDLDSHMRNKGKLEEIRKKGGFTFVHNRKMDENSCLTATNSDKDTISIEENGSIQIKRLNTKNNKTSKAKKEFGDYCIESKVKESNIMAKPRIIFRWMSCTDNFQEFDGKFMNINECQDNNCIAKCCNGNDNIFYIFNDDNDVETVKCMEKSSIERLANKSIHIDYSKVPILKNNYGEKFEIGNKNLNHYRFFYNQKLSKGDCSSDIKLKPKLNHHILEDNLLLIEAPNYYKRFVWNFKMGDFCIEHVIKQTAEGIKGPFVIFRHISVSPIETTDDSQPVLKSTAMLISCFFLILVLFVYGVIRELQNIVGMVMMAYVGTLTVTFLLKAVELLGLEDNTTMTEEVCKPLSLFLYFTILSTFFWMNIMSFDIWWTFRGMLNSRPIHRRGELVKFGWYALYAWGVPFLVTVAVGVIDYADLRHMPNFYKPHFENCFYINDVVTEMRHYLYFPISILVTTDWFFFLLTAFNIWLKKKNISKFSDAKKYNNNQNRFGVYIKLALLMGVSWILEVVNLPDWLQLAASLYNGLVGVAIFFIFVFKKSILFKLCKRFNINNKYVENMRRKSTATTSQSIRTNTSEVSPTC